MKWFNWHAFTFICHNLKTQISFKYPLEITNMHIQHKLSHFWKVELKTTVMDHGALKLEMHNKRIN